MKEKLNLKLRHKISSFLLSRKIIDTALSYVASVLIPSDLCRIVLHKILVIYFFISFSIVVLSA